MYFVQYLSSQMISYYPVVRAAQRRGKGPGYGTRKTSGTRRRGSPASIINAVRDVRPVGRRDASVDIAAVAVRARTQRSHVRVLFSADLSVIPSSFRSSVRAFFRSECFAVWPGLTLRHRYRIAVRRPQTAVQTFDYRRQMFRKALIATAPECVHLLIFFVRLLSQSAPRGGSRRPSSNERTASWTEGSSCIRYLYIRPFRSNVSTFRPVI